MAQTVEPLTLGIEEEFQIVSGTTTELVSGYPIIIPHRPDALQKHMKPEFLRCVIECITPVCRTFDEVVAHTMSLRATAIRMAEQEGMALISGGTHPSSLWQHQERTVQVDDGGVDRYGLLEGELQDVARSILIWGLHVHVSIPDPHMRIAVMNQARTYLPYLLALSANSPFHAGRDTGFASYRTIIWSPFPVSGIPDAFPSWYDFKAYREQLLQLRVIGDTRRLWWDIRPHPDYPTLEFRITDMPFSYRTTLALIALVQALVAMIMRRIEAGDPLPVYSRAMLEENRWRAALHGIRATFIDYAQKRERSAKDLILETLDAVRSDALRLGTASYLSQIEEMFREGYRTPGDLLREAFRTSNGDITAVNRRLMTATREGIDMSKALPLQHLGVPGPDKQR